ncbi:GmrSD restriction endonuclease domain-containing protein [Arthrobacter sp. TMN-37]
MRKPFGQSPASNPMPEGPKRRRIERSTWIAIAVALLAIVVADTANLTGGALGSTALVFLATGLYALVSGRPSWLRLPDRKAAGIAVAVSVVALIAGILLNPPADAPERTAAADKTAVSAPAETPSPPPTPTPRPSTTKAPEPTPTPTLDVAPLDTDEVPALTVQGAVAPQSQPAAGTKALALLETLPIKGRAPKTGYDRDQFGTAWADVDRNGCDTRNDILKTQLYDIVFANSVPCKVAAGVLDDPYTATTIRFIRGQATSSAVQIDHVVALSDAWQKGAQQLSPEQRMAFANDPLNLQATDGPTNQQKGDGDAATWLPPSKAFRCTYVATQISVKATYGLWVTQAEHDAMASVLGSCGDIDAPTNQEPPVVEPAPVPAQPEPVPAAPAPAPAPVAPAPAPVAPAPVVPAPAPAPYYPNCAAVRAAGMAPINISTPGYGPHLDRDGDGWGCDS